VQIDLENSYLLHRSFKAELLVRAG